MEEDLCSFQKGPILKKLVKSLLGLEPYERIAPRVRSFFGIGQMPSFLIIGQQKCGTTSLYDAICQHSKVEPAITKQSHFFDRSFRLGLGFYKAHFKAGAKYCGEATPDYFDHPKALQRIKDLALRVPLVLVLRDPLERALSHYQMSKALGFENLGFEEALLLEKDRIASPFGIERFAYRYKSDYKAHYQKWKQAFGNQLLVLSLEEIKTQEGLTRVQKHLGLKEEVLVMKHLNKSENENLQLVSDELKTEFDSLCKEYHEILEIERHV